MYSPEVELTEIFVSNIFNGNGFAPSDIPTDTKNTTRGRGGDKMQILDSEPVYLESGSLDQ